MNYSVRISERVVSRLKRRPCPRHHLRVASIGSVSTEHFHATQHALWVAHRSKFECPTSEMGRVSRAFSWSMKLRVTVREMKEGPSGSAIMGFVSRVTPVQTALRNCTGDEGGPFGFGDQVADPKPPQAAAVKSRGGERCGKVGTRSRQVWSREASASEPSMKCRKLLR